MTKPRASAAMMYRILLLVFVVAAARRVTYTYDAVREMQHAYTVAPFDLSAPWPTVYRLNRAALNAGLRKGDRLLSIDGKPVPGRQDVVAPFHNRKSTDAMPLRIDRGGQTLDLTVQPTIVGFGAGWLSYTFGTISWILMPWCAFALGFWVTAVRPRDPFAWMVLGILAGLADTTNAGILNGLGWPGAGPVLLGYHNLADDAWPIAMMLFGIYFPGRWRVDKAAPWAKWLIITPVAAVSLWDAAYDMTAAVSVNAAAGWGVPHWAQQVYVITSMIATGAFFAAIASKFRDAALAADARRRLKLLYFGISAGFTPMFLLILYTLTFHHRMPADEDDVFLAVALMFFLLVPLTMAYVLVVQRAMDVRMVLRQGVQYALARRGLGLLQMLFGALIILIALNIGGASVSATARFLMVAAGGILVSRLRGMGEKLRGWLDRRFFREAYNSDQILNDLSEHVRSILDTHSLLDTVTRRISESLHVDRLAVMLYEGGAFRPALATGYPAGFDLSLPDDAPAIARLRGSRDPLIASHEPIDGLEALQPELVLPLSSKKELLGFITLGPKKSEEPYSPSDASLLRTVASQTGLALENSRLAETVAAEIAQRELLNREIEIAREVQQRLFPQSSPECSTLEYAGHCRPARGVGGDYYDFIALPDGRLGIAIADISGKGIPAALLMASLQASVRGQSQGSESSVAGLMASVNKLVYDASPANRYATFFYAQFDASTRRLTYANGGHNPPIILRGSDAIRLEKGGPPVGLFRPALYEQDVVELEAGDLLVLFTDGISEAENAAQEEWGEEALEKTARACGTSPADVIADIMSAADAFAAGAPQHDDMTLVIARVR